MMKIPCEVVRDLFPSYIDDLTSPESNQIIEDHLAECNDCRNILNSMKSSSDVGIGPLPDESKEIDFLKKNRRRNKLILIGSIAVILIIIAVIFVNRYVAGEQNADNMGDWFLWDINVDGNHLDIEGRSVQHIFKITRMDFREEDGVLYGTAYTVPSGLIAGLIYGDEFRGSYTSKEPIRRVQINDRILWSEGEEVSILASALYCERNQYIGNMSGNSRVASILSIPNYLGAYTNELKTDKPPYEWTVKLWADVSPQYISRYESDMEKLGYVLLAAVENMDAVNFEYKASGKDQFRKVTSDEASEFFGQDIKNCFNDVNLLDDLIHKAGLGHYAFGYGENYISSQTGSSVTGVNDAQDIQGISMSVYIDGQLISTEGAVNADGTPAGIGDLFSFSIEPEAVTPHIHENCLVELEFSVETPVGKAYNIPDKMRIPVNFFRLFDLHITGNASDGFEVAQ